MLKFLLKSLYYTYILLPRNKFIHYKVLRRIRERGYANVIFMAANLPMWRYQGLYELINKDKRFHVSIILAPFKAYSDIQKKDNISELRKWFDSQNIAYIDSTTWKDDDYNIRKHLNPDIIFYTQPYEHVYGNSLDNIHFEDILLCYTSYATAIPISPYSVNTRLQNVAWKCFYESEAFKQKIKKITYNRAKNVVVSGNPYADEFLKKEHLDVWKPQKTIVKRIIWAPHFTVVPSPILQRGSFLWLYDFMFELAEIYRDKIQIAFKPHPMLKTKLYEIKEWGKERTDNYYRKWDMLPNGQLEEGKYIDLFMTSNALIHDSSSFTSEYHYTHNPILFTTNKGGIQCPNLDEIGQAAFKAQYFAKSKEDIIRFIENIVINNIDIKKNERMDFFLNYLLPPKGGNVAENMYKEIITSIWS